MCQWLRLPSFLNLPEDAGPRASFRWSQGLTVGTAASWRMTGFGGGCSSFFDFLPPLVLFSFLVVSEEPLVGAVEDSSSLVVVLAEAAKSGEETPDVGVCAFSSCFARSTALSLATAGLFDSEPAFCDSAGLSLASASTSSAQLAPGVSSEIELLPGVVVPDVALCGGCHLFSSAHTGGSSGSAQPSVLSPTAHCSVSLRTRTLLRGGALFCGRSLLAALLFFWRCRNAAVSDVDEAMDGMRCAQGEEGFKDRCSIQSAEVDAATTRVGVSGRFAGRGRCGGSGCRRGRCGAVGVLQAGTTCPYTLAR
ncbi:hypothetical protein KC357_g18 [Hortaea werneckii]|nr:hypothetical protein KC357_g18 [Hortaea werneckii]